jgi:hypothetical protein
MRRRAAPRRNRAEALDFRHGRHHGRLHAVGTPGLGGVRAPPALALDVPDLMRRTTGRTAECMRELFQPRRQRRGGLAQITEKETIYRELFAPVFAEVSRLQALCRPGACARGLKIGVGTAGDRHNIAFALSHLRWTRPRMPLWVATRACPASPSPPSFWRPRGAWAPTRRTASCLKTRPLASKRPAAPACGRGGLHQPHRRGTGRPACDGQRCATFDELIESNFLETLHVAAS